MMLKMFYRFEVLLFFGATTFLVAFSSTATFFFMKLNLLILISFLMLCE